MDHGGHVRGLLRHRRPHGEDRHTQGHVDVVGGARPGRGDEADQDHLLDLLRNRDGHHEQCQGSRGEPHGQGGPGLPADHVQLQSRAVAHRLQPHRPGAGGRLGRLHVGEAAEDLREVAHRAARDPEQTRVLRLGPRRPHGDARDGDLRHVQDQGRFRGRAPGGPHRAPEIPDDALFLEDRGRVRPGLWRPRHHADRHGRQGGGLQELREVRRGLRRQRGDHGGPVRAHGHAPVPEGG
mmetsp:Transcript_13729/g.27991  ORF Transcript_13729/g.27991 Transcript_13729/m.27991 type:complete len:238 (+) Transcript_13729:231-944(+)